MSWSARVVIIGAGVVGASAAYHLAELGWTDVVVVDKGPIPETGGSSSHAPGLVFQTNPSKMMTELARYTVELYSALDVDGEPCFLEVGGIEVATTPARWRELQRKHGFATAWGLDATLLTPDEVAAHVPLVDPARILGGYHVASDGLAKAVRGVDAMLRHAQRKGVELRGETEVTGFELRDGRVHAVRTTTGDITTPIVLCCAGIWGPKVGRMAGVSIPVHRWATSTRGPRRSSSSGRRRRPRTRSCATRMHRCTCASTTTPTGWAATSTARCRCGPRTSPRRRTPPATAGTPACRRSWRSRPTTSPSPGRTPASCCPPWPTPRSTPR